MARSQRTARWIRDNILGGDGVSTIVDSDTGTAHDVGDDLASNATTFIEEQSPSGVSEVDFTSSFANHRTHMFYLSNVIPATDAVALEMLTSSDGGSTFDNSANDYFSGGTEMTLVSPVGSDSGEDGISGSVYLYGTGLSKRTIVRGQATFFNQSGSISVVDFGDARDAAEDVDAVRFKFSSGNIESGVIEHLGVN